ncbi:cancer-associated gene 1 protein isoform X2 [Talpa occidentalis]|uniref:cancer-associated gene 1 protein isoform X2 n=1 Tax=Talpa occidentalis TaxID=50954 RepID=UPI0023F8EDF4|nr:cancer-associated gene 1 protein isoform X2 [Talpa occidentalis]
MVHPKEVPAEDAEGHQIVPAGMWSPAGLSWSGGASPEDHRSPDTEQSLESFQPLEEDMALNEVLQKLRQTNQKQQTRIYNLQCSNRYLEKKVAELQRRTAKQQVFLDVISKLKENVEELIEDKYRVMLEKNDTEKTLQKVHKVLASTQGHLQDCRHEKEALQLELKKVKTSYVHLQERYVNEMQQKNETLSQCVERDKTLSRKEEEVQQLQQLKGELEKATACALDLLKREKETREQELLSLQEEFQRQEKENLAERQKLKSRLENLIAQVKNLQIVSENEKEKNTQLQEQIDRVRRENARLQQQVTRTEMPPPSPLPALAKEPSQDIPGPIPEPSITQNARMLRPHLLLGCSRRPGEEESPDPPDMKRAAQLASKIHSLLALLVGFLMCQPQGVTSPDTEPVKDGEKVSDIMLQKLKSFHHKKKNLDKELLKHKDRITTFRELIANEKAFQDQVIETTDFDLGEASSASDIPVLLGAKLDKYHNLNEELDFLIGKLGNLLESKENHCNRLIAENDRCQRHLGDLINKVMSYEEIIECADQRLELSHFHITHLEQRNKHLEDLIKKPRERARKLRPRVLEQHPKSTTAVVRADSRCGQSHVA